MTTAIQRHPRPGLALGSSTPRTAPSAKLVFAVVTLHLLQANAKQIQAHIRPELFNQVLCCPAQANTASTRCYAARPRPTPQCYAVRPTPHCSHIPNLWVGGRERPISNVYRYERQKTLKIRGQRLRG